MISFEAPLGSDIRDCDESLLMQVEWTKAVPRRIRRQLEDGDGEAFAESVQSDLASRLKTRRRLKRSDSCWTHLESRWSHSAFELHQRTGDLIESLQKAYVGDLEEVLESWLVESSDGPPVSSMELLIATDLLSVFHSRLSAGLFWRIWKRILGASLHFVNSVDAASDEDLTADQRLVVVGELPWRVGTLFHSVQGAKELRQRGRAEFERQIQEYTDTDGTPFAALLERLPEWIAAFTRFLTWGGRFGVATWKGDPSTRYQQLLIRVIYMLDANTRLPFATDKGDLLESMTTSATQSGLSDSEPAAKLLKKYLKARQSDGKGRSAVKGRLDCSSQSDWSRVAIARSKCCVASDQFTVLHHLPTLQVSLGLAGQPLFEGPWSLELSVNNKAVKVEGDWSCSCWNSDRDGDYIEYEIELAGGVRVTRVLFLSRSDQFLICLEYAVAKEGSEVELESRLPLAEGWKSRAATDSREWKLKRKKQKVRALPLYLPDDPVLSAAGAMGADGDNLVTEVRGIKTACSAVLLSWDSSVDRSYADWRSLTVTEEQREVSPAGATAFRLRLGDRQWLIYRRLNDSTELQSVIGYHSGHETAIGYFGEDGELEPLLLVEADQ